MRLNTKEGGYQSYGAADVLTESGAGGNHALRV